MFLRSALLVAVLLTLQSTARAQFLDPRSRELDRIAEQLRGLEQRRVQAAPTPKPAADSAVTQALTLPPPPQRSLWDRVKWELEQVPLGVYILAAAIVLVLAFRRKSPGGAG